MNIKEIQSGYKSITVEARVITKSPSREVDLRTGEKAEVCDCTIGDRTGEIKLSLWNEDIDRVKVGNKVSISNGYCTTFKGELQLNTGRYGKICVIHEQDTLTKKK